MSWLNLPSRPRDCHRSINRRCRAPYKERGRFRFFETIEDHASIRWGGVFAKMKSCGGDRLHSAYPSLAAGAPVTLLLHPSSIAHSAGASQTLTKKATLVNPQGCITQSRENHPDRYGPKWKYLSHLQSLGSRVQKTSDGSVAKTWARGDGV